MLATSITRNGVLLGLFAIATTAVIAGTYLGTQHRIADNQRHAEQRALLEIVPAETHDNQLADDTVAVDDPALLGLRQSRSAYIARRDGRAVAVILPVTARDGYTGDIDLIVGVNADGSVAGVRVLAHRETPGLGDKIELGKSDWLLGFNGRSLQSPPLEQWTVRKDGGAFDQFTGATITPRAVTQAVARSLQYFQTHREQLLAATGTDDPALAGQAETPVRMPHE